MRRTPAYPHSFIAPLLFLSLGLQSGCGLIFGGDQHVDTKSKDYAVHRLDQRDPHQWALLPDFEVPNQDGLPSERVDFAFENKINRAIISLNSACTGVKRDDAADSEKLSRLLLLGLDDDHKITSKPVEVDGKRAHESEILIQTSQTRVRTVVLAHQGCTYDFMLIAKSKVFQEMDLLFQQFLKGFHVLP